MARHDSIKHLLRQMPNALLVRYFQAQSLFADHDFARMKEGRRVRSSRPRGHAVPLAKTTKPSRQKAAVDAIRFRRRRAREPGYHIPPSHLPIMKLPAATLAQSAMPQSVSTITTLMGQLGSVAMLVSS